MSKPQIYFFREGFWASIISDSYTFGLLVGSVWFNKHFIGGSYFLNCVLLFMFIVMLVGKGSSRRITFNSREELIAHLQEGK